MKLTNMKWEFIIHKSKSGYYVAVEVYDFNDNIVFDGCLFRGFEDEEDACRKQCYDFVDANEIGNYVVKANETNKELI